MKTIKKIDPLSFAKISGVLYAILGFIFGLIFSLVALISSLFSSSEGKVFAGLYGGGLSIIISPIIYGVMGFLMGLVSAWLYNLAASWIGGIKIELK
ncbi:MAG: hypothetical protein ACFFG0_55440 [Candidatus Thorarchaeota archaeon]